MDRRNLLKSVCAEGQHRPWEGVCCDAGQGRRVYGVPREGLEGSRPRSRQHVVRAGAERTLPTYIVRQLYDFHGGARSGAGAQLMKPIAAQMTVQQMTDVAAYFASLEP